MGHIKYNKVYALHKEEVGGILDTGRIVVQEKIDGANTSIWLDYSEDESITFFEALRFGSRNHEVPEFNGIREYTEKHNGIINLLSRYPHYRLFGEWLIKHTITYNETAYRNFYLFDILDESTGEFLHPHDVYHIAEEYQICSPVILYDGNAEDITLETIQEYVGKSELGDRGEGVVIKNVDYTSKFGVKPQYAKIVTESFKEDNAVTFGGNNKHSEHYYEIYFTNKYMTLPRVRKVIQKLESMEDRKMQIEDCRRIAGIAVHDMMQEEITEMMKKKGATINLGQLNRISTKKAIQIFKDMLTGIPSIADEVKE